MTKEEVMKQIDEAHARLVEKYGALAPTKEYFKLIVVGAILDRLGVK